MDDVDPDLIRVRFRHDASLRESQPHTAQLRTSPGRRLYLTFSANSVIRSSTRRVWRRRRRSRYQPRTMRPAAPTGPPHRSDESRKVRRQAASPSRRVLIVTGPSWTTLMLSWVQPFANRGRPAKPVVPRQTPAANAVFSSWRNPALARGREAVRSFPLDGGRIRRLASLLASRSWMRVMVRRQASRKPRAHPHPSFASLLQRRATLSFPPSRGKEDCAGLHWYAPGAPSLSRHPRRRCACRRRRGRRSG